MRHENPGHLLESAALVNEAFLKLVDQRGIQWQNRAHFFAIAAQAIRRILVDHARTKNRAKRGGAVQTVVLDERIVAFENKGLEILALDDALTALEKLAPEQSRVVELRFFAGLTAEETAETMGISRSTVNRDWVTAKAWLIRELRRGEATRADVTA
jgi:RNA polymerase sigma factor (TIGR02999 family)